MEPAQPQAGWPAVAAACGLPGTVVEVAQVSRAWSNRLYRVTTGEGEFAVKHLLNPWADPLWREWLDEASRFEQAAIAAGVSAPDLVLNGDSEVLTTVEGDTFRVHRWVDDARPCPDAPTEAALARQVGADLARMHRLDWQPGRTDVFPTLDPATARSWSGLVADLAAVDPEWAERAAAVQPQVDQVLAWHAEHQARPESTVMSHGDVDPKNLVVDGDQKVWVLDWDVAAPWRPWDELARTALSMSGHDRPDIAREVIEAYTEVAGVRPRLTHLNLVADLVVGLDWTDRCLRRTTGLEPCDDQRRAEATEGAADELASLPEIIEIARNLPDWLTS
ncbi:phosphotransferase family protein [Aestuariimicrobium ganziense]|uniref:phosphotransferase family protein n=1 Tax=Aestuariimicrobium ganziense TaxID=2773677 RepID=UPI001941B081|nr:phosphotransferase [Aestuariimicrobium ganziense]